MFKKGPELDKKKLLLKASDVKKDSLTRLKHFKTLIEHLDFNELPLLFRSHFSFIYHTFIDTFSTFDCNSKQRRDDLDCILYMFEKILVHNPELIKKKWQFYSITFVMQKLLHRHNTWRLRQEGVRLFVLWYQILCDEENIELQTMFASLVPGIVPDNYLTRQPVSDQQYRHNVHSSEDPHSPQIPIKLCSIDPLVPMTSAEQPLSDETSFYLDNLLQFMVTQTTKPHWMSQDDAKKNQELGFSFLFNMFKKVYLQQIFPNFDTHTALDHSPKSHIVHSIHQYVDEVNETCQSRSHMNDNQNVFHVPSKGVQNLSHIDLKQSSHTGSVNVDYDSSMSLSVYQSIVIRWLTRILRQDMIPGQDEFTKPGGSAERRDFQGGFRENSSGQLQYQELSHAGDGNSTTIYHNMETTSCEMEIARRITGTWPENIAVIHELFRRAFLNYLQPASMKRVVNVYKEWICNGGPSQSNVIQPKSLRVGYTSFGDLLQVFVVNSSSAFISQVHNQAMLDEQVEMCKRIMNIYRYMVMKIYMNTSTWEQLLNVMLSITERLFPATPPEKKETTIGGRIAPAFFQTFIVSWIRANLYVHISRQMWNKFHRVMMNLIKWRELIEEWSTTMGSLTRVLVKHVYGLSLTDLPLDKPQERRRRPKTIKGFSTTEPIVPKQESDASKASDCTMSKRNTSGLIHLARPRGLVRSNSDGILDQTRHRIYYSYTKTADNRTVGNLSRKIKSEHILFDPSFDSFTNERTMSPSHNDVMDSGLKDPNMIIDTDHVIESHTIPNRQSDGSKATNRSQDLKSEPDKCVLLGGSVRGWTPENSVIMWRRMSGLFGNINMIDDPENHLVVMRCLAVMLCDFIKTRENLGISVDNQSTPSQPKLVPPYTYYVGWLLEATHLPEKFRESRLTAYKLLCLMSIRRHDIELPQQYYTAFYEAIHRGLNSPDPKIYSSIIKHSAQLLSLELPGSTCLVHDLFERSRSILANSPRELSTATSPRDQALQILNTILSLHRPIKKLMVLKSDGTTSMNLVAPGDIRNKIFETLLACNTRPLDCQTRSQSLCALASHVYQELCDKFDYLGIERLFDCLFIGLQDQTNSELFRMNCDLLRLFSDHGSSLAQSKPTLVSSTIQIVSQLIVRLSTDAANKEAVHCLLICLEDWCIAVGKNYLMKPLDQSCNDEDENALSYSNESLIVIALRSLENVINDEPDAEESSNKGNKTFANSSKGSESNVGGHAINSDNGPRDRTITNEDRSRRSDKTSDEGLLSIKLACKVCHCKLVTYLGHFPLRQVGAASLSCCVNEADYLACEQELNDLKKMSDLSLLVVNESTIISFIGTTGSKKPIHLIVRNLCGKYSWDATCLYIDSNQQRDHDEKESIVVDPDTFQQDESRSSMKYDSDFNEDGNSSSSISSRSSTSRDCIGELLNQLSSLMANGSAVSSSQNLYKKRNSAQSISNPKYRVAQAEETMIALLTNQRFQELNYCERSDDFDKVELNFHKKSCSNKSGYLASVPPLESVSQRFTFEPCRQLIQQLGYLTWEKRNKIDSLAKSVRLLRELKNLDAQTCRETHKIAVIYVANCQEDKNSILTNSSGSKGFEDFVSGLGWEVNLSSHLGFKGGLQSNKSTGETSPYYCNSTTEVMFHVSTRIPIPEPVDDEALNKKLRHLGNDEIHIVWSEHSRDYRRGIIPTEFGDVIIAIYPLITFLGYYRIQILNKPDVPAFGPLVDNCIVHQTSLASLVRATAINASRAKRLKIPYYQSHLEERSRLIETIVQNHKEKLSFEDFASQLYQTSNVRNQQHEAKQDTLCCA